MAKLQIGDFAPNFQASSSINPSFRFETTGGRRIVLSFLGSLQRAPMRAILGDFAAAKDWIAANRTFFFPVSCDAADSSADVVQAARPYTIFWDFDRHLAALYGVLDEPVGTAPQLSAGSYVLDENRRVLAFVPVGAPEQHASAVLSVIANLPPDEPPKQVRRQAPVLIVPDILSRDFCASLIHAYEVAGGVDSGYMTDREGKTVGVVDYYHKRRSDWFIEDEPIRHALTVAVASRLAPEIKKAFQFDATRMERLLVARYDSATADHFRPHRDDNAEATAHRRFAVTINLNAAEYEGGDLRFPEYGQDIYRPDTGMAVVFSCSLMHEVLPVTAGRRYAFLPFLYDEAAQLGLEAYLRKRGAAESGEAAPAIGQSAQPT